MPAISPNIAQDQDAALRSTLKTSVYPGASDAAIAQVVEYCRAAGLDPMTKPVHIVPQWVREHIENGRKVAAGVQDIVLPGIGLYRTQAHRTREYAGHDEPEFGPTIEQAFAGVSLKFPEWCRVTVYRMNGTVRASYSARIYWLETYAATGNDSDEPELMWRKRPYGQLEKCAEALALRKAFPEAVGSQPTAEEMEGRLAAPRIETAPPTAPVLEMPRARPTSSDADPLLPVAASVAASPLGWHVSASKQKLALAKARAAGMTEVQLLQRHPSITDSHFADVLADLTELATSGTP